MVSKPHSMFVRTAIPRFIILDPNGEYARAFSDLDRVCFRWRAVTPQGNSRCRRGCGMDRGMVCVYRRCLWDATSRSCLTRSEDYGLAMANKMPLQQGFVDE